MSIKGKVSQLLVERTMECCISSCQSYENDQSIMSTSCRDLTTHEAVVA